MLAQIQTKSNYRNLNGRVLEVAEKSGKGRRRRVTCWVQDRQFGLIKADFYGREVKFVKG